MRLCSSPFLGFLLAGLATCLPDPGCIVDPSRTDVRYRLFTSDRAPLIRDGESSLRAATAADEPGPQKARDMPSFSIEKPQDASNSFCDIVTVEEPRMFVAMASDGDLILTNSSTGSNEADHDGQRITTSIFAINCSPRISVANFDKQLIILPIISDEELSRNSGTDDMTTIKDKDTKVPRCDWQDPAVAIFNKPGAPPNSHNGCGSTGTEWVPELYFHECCNTHDLCYGICPTTFEGCNDGFGQCMEQQCKNGTWMEYAFCMAARRVYELAVTGGGGEKAFCAATKKFCECRKGGKPTVYGYGC